MKGIVFAEFTEFAEDQFGFDVIDEVIEAADLPSGGSYTAVGTYDHREMLSLVTELSARTEIPVDELCRLYGRHLLGRFSVLYPKFFKGVPDCFSFLKTIENHIHVEVKKLYPDAELPSFTYENSNPDELTLVYRSRRPFGHLARGLVEGSIEHFGENIQTSVCDNSGVHGAEVHFHLIRTIEQFRPASGF